MSLLLLKIASLFFSDTSEKEIITQSGIGIGTQNNYFIITQ